MAADDAMKDMGRKESMVPRRGGDYARRLLREMVAAQQRGEGAVQEVVAAALDEMGGRVDVEKITYTPQGTQLKDEFASDAIITPGERVAIVGRYCARKADAGGAFSGRSLIMFAHPDGEDPEHAPPGAGPGSWTRPPFEATIEDRGAEGCLMYGWGIADDIMGVAAGVCAMRELYERGVAPRGELIMASTPSKRHARGCAELVQRGYGADAACYLHPAESGAGLQEVKAYTSGQLLVRVRVVGSLPTAPPPPHGDHPHWAASITPEGDGMCAFAFTANSALDKCLLIRDALMRLGVDREKRVHHPTMHAAAGKSTSVLVSSLVCSAGKLSSVPLVGELGASVTFPPTESLGSVKAEVAAAIETCASRDDWLKTHPPVIDFVSGVTGAEVSEDNPLYRAVSESISASTGIEPHVNPMHTSSDIRVPAVQLGIPCVGFGSRSGNLAQNGLSDEWIDLDDFDQMVDALVALVDRWCGLVDM